MWNASAGPAGGIAALLVLLTPGPGSAGQPPVRFEAQTIDDDVEIGYGVAIGEVDGDGRPDILLADKSRFVWYRNPGWERHVLAEDLTEDDNVCIAARDIDGDGRVEVAVGAAWNPGDTVGSGAVFSLVPPEDRTQLWTPVRLHHEPTVHRMRWVRLAGGGHTLVVAPLHGRGNEGGEGAGVRLLAYAMPDDPRAEWETTVLEDSLHVTHNLDPAQWDPESEAEEILYIGREGAILIAREGESWARRTLEGVRGGGEIRLGRHSSGEPFVVTIEPLHGTELVHYRFAPSGSDASAPLAVEERTVLDAALSGGHALATADLFGGGSDQVVAGWRRPNGGGRVGLKLYYRVGDAAEDWASILIDDDGMAAEDVRVGDLDADGRPDLIAAGRSTRNLKVYWNREAASTR